MKWNRTVLNMPNYDESLDTETIWGTQHHDPAKGTSWTTPPNGIDTRRPIPLRKKYREQS